VQAQQCCRVTHLEANRCAYSAYAHIIPIQIAWLLSELFLRLHAHI
jgi:hypothetical protein